jgi:hypothetical protein
MGVSMEQPFYGLGSGVLTAPLEAVIHTTVRYYRSFILFLSLDRFLHD